MSKLCPISLRQAQAFVGEHHRHNSPPQGHKFSIGLMENGTLIGVVIAGNPIARKQRDGYTAEITRCCVLDGYGTLRIVKRDAANGAPLGGAAVKIKHIATNATHEGITDSSGCVVFDKLPVGGYEIVEMAAPDGYQLDAAVHTVNVTSLSEGESSYVLTNKANAGLRIIKFDRQTVTPIEGVSFEIWKDGELYTTQKTDAWGEIELRNLPSGTYTARELATVNDYVLDSTAQWVEIKAGQGYISELYFFNLLKPGMNIVKVDSETYEPLPGAKFKISQVGASFTEEYTTDKDGEIDLSALEPGAYTLQEIYAPAGYLMEEAIRTIQLNPGETAQFVFTNTKKPALIVLKIDAETTKPLPGAEFSIKHKDGSVVWEGLTDENGEIRLYNLDPDWYTVTEILPPPGYIADTAAKDVKFEPGETIQVKFDNTRKPVAIFQKTNALTGKGVEGATFMVQYEQSGGGLLNIGSYKTDSIAEFGLVSSTANSRAFNADSAYYLLSSLEILDEDGELERKADMFTKRTIKQKTVITHVDTASEALAVSLGERAKVDMAFMSELTGRSEDELFSELNGVVYKDFFGFPDGKFVYRTADEFLSGNVRKKLNHYRVGLGYTRESHPNYATILDAVTALEAVQPKDLEAGEISVRLGSTWIDPEYVQQFMYQLLDTSWRNQGQYKIHYHKLTGEWQVSGKGRAQYSDIAATVTYGTERMNAYQIIDDTLNLRDVRVYDYKQDADGKDQRILNKKQTTLAQQKQELIKQKFKDWLWQDPERRQTLVRKYNDLFNSVRLREYDGSHITFDGINPEIRLNKHQVDGVARHLYGGNTLYGHVVGAGKTFTMIAAAQESKRLGLCQKSLIAVPNHLTDQWAAEYLRLYPSANILVATKKDFEMRNRKKFCAKIATGDYDAVIVGHSQLEKIPMSRERQERQIREQIWEIEDGLRDLKAAKGERYSIKQLEKTRRGLETRLKKLLESKTRDDVVTFEQLGVDRLFVDESHQFKNLFLYTKMRNVAGLSTSEAQKSSDLFGKCRYLDELTGGKGIVFATGTPISNSMSEMYTVQRYLQYDTLSAKGLTHFDAWASIFGETVTSIELAPEGTGYRARTRFARFHNLPELMAMFREVADIQTADMLGLPVPEAKYENIIVEPSELQQEMVQELSERAAAVHRKEVDPSTDNMLKITTDGRKIGLDQRLINPLLPDFEGSKVNACTDNIHRIWQETSGDRLTQLVFSDFSTPNKDGRFNIYDDIRKKLLERGVPESEIAFIHDADTEVKKKELFAKVRQGKVRILLGSTFKMGAGTNVQDKLVALHDVDCPWRPADLEQRSGRIIRQGNTNDEVQIYRYATSGTFDSYLWQTVQKKQEFIAQIMSSKSPVRSAEDVDETALSYAEIKALCAGNPLIAEKMNLDNEVAKLRMLKAEHKNQHYRLEDNLLGHFPKQITAVTERIGGIEKDIAAYAVEKEKTAQATMTEGAALVENKFPGMTVNGTFHAEKEPASKALLEACKGVKGRNTDVAIGEYMGFQMGLRYESFGQQINLMLRGAMTYQIDLGTDALGNITRINNALEKLPERLAGAQTQLEDLHHQVEAAKLELAKPFEQEQELQAKEARLALLNADLNIDGDGDMDVENDIESRDDDVEFDRDEVFDFEPVRAASYAKARPSIMESLHRYEGDKQSEALGLSKPSERDI